MSERQETVADVLEKMRNFARVGRGHEGTCSDLIESYADRIEAAHKREMSKIVSKNGADFGQLVNAAKMREALLALKELDFNKEEDCHAFYRIIDAALAAPPRTCERFETAEDAKKEFNYLWNFVWKRGGGCVDEREYRSEYEKWLFSPIQEGESDGRK